MTDPRPRAGDGNLKPRDEQFCQEYIVDYNGSKAAIRAGFPEKSARIRACELLAKPDIQARVAELLAEQQQRTGITADWTLQKLVKVAERCTTEETFDAAGANRSLELIGRHQGIFEADNRQRAPRGEAERIAAIDAEIEEMMARGNTGDGAPTKH
jgi:phage terminase small subunit